MADITFKKARKKDRSAIKALAQELEPSDWLPEVLDYLYNIEPGGLFVGLVDDSPVAVSMILFPRPGEAFLGAMRVAAAMQKKGVGTSFTSYLVSQAQKMGADVVRLMIEPENEPSIKLVKKIGFEPVGDWRICTNLDLDMDLPASGVSVPGPRNLAQVRAYFTQNSRRSNPAGLSALTSPWDVASMGWPDVQQAVSARQILLRHGKEGIDGALIYGEDEEGDDGPTLLIRYFEGEKVAREHLIRYFSRLVRDRGAAKVHASLPEPQALGLEDSLPGDIRSHNHIVFELRPAGGG